MAIGYALVDVATPGRLHELIWVNRNRNAALLLVSNVAGVGIIVVAAIVSSEDDFVAGIVGARGVRPARPGHHGRGVRAAGPGDARSASVSILVDPEPHPAAWVSAVVHLATSAIIAAAIV